MKYRHLIFAGAILVLGLVCVGLYKLSLTLMVQRQATMSSDARVNTKIRIGGDNYLGYFFSTSPEMTRQALKRGLAVDFTDDGGDYDARLKKFSEGGYDAIVLPINSYLSHGLQYNYPGVIVSSIAESKGADAIACFADKLPTGKVTDLNDASLKIVYTSESPSSFLLDLTMVDFDLFNLKSTDAWRVTVGGSKEVYEKAKRHEGDCFVMWEPDVSRALRDVPGLKKVWGSDNFSGYIDDVFVFRREFVNDHHDQLVQFLEAYFSTMRSYSGDRNRLIGDIRQATNLQQPDIETMLKEISWYNLQQNASLQFGLNTGVGTNSTEGVLNTIIASTNVLVRTGKLTKPLDDPYKIIYSKILEQVLQDLPKEVGQASGKREFSALSVDDWKGLKEIGTMRVEPITFASQSAVLSDSGQAQVDKIADLLVNNYPDTRVVIRGHTGPGDEQANIALSQARAEAVMQQLIAVHGISANRLKAVGMGSSQPPQRRPDDNPRTIGYRAPRVEFSLYQDSGF